MKFFGKKTKPIFCVFFAAVFFMSIAVCSSAEASNIVSEISQTRDFYIEKNEPPSLFEENIAFAAAGVFGLSNLTVTRIDGNSVIDRAKDVLSLLAAGETVDDGDIKFLTESQKEDGSFGGFYETVYAIMALKASNAVFGSQQAVNALIAYQNEAGAYAAQTEDENTAILQTAAVLSAITVFSTDNTVAASIGSAVAYLQNIQKDDGTFGDGSAITLSAVIMAVANTGETPNSDGWKNLLNVLNKYKNADGSYRNHTEDEAVYGKEATAAALCALHTLGKNESPLKRLMLNGNLVEYNIKDYLPFLIGYCAAALLAVVFWIFIFRRKKDNKTLYETKELI